MVQLALSALTDVVDTRIFGALDTHRIQEIFTMNYKTDSNNLFTPEEIQSVEEELTQSLDLQGLRHKSDS